MVLPRSILMRIAICVTITVSVLGDNGERTIVADARTEESQNNPQRATHSLGGYGGIGPGSYSHHGIASYGYPGRRISPVVPDGHGGRFRSGFGAPHDIGIGGGSIDREGHRGIDSFLDIEKEFGDTRKASHENTGGENHQRAYRGGSVTGAAQTGHGGIGGVGYGNIGHEGYGIAGGYGGTRKVSQGHDGGENQYRGGYGGGINAGHAGHGGIGSVGYGNIGHEGHRGVYGGYGGTRKVSHGHSGGENHYQRGYDGNGHARHGDIGSVGYGNIGHEGHKGVDSFSGIGGGYGDTRKASHGHVGGVNNYQGGYVGNVGISGAHGNAGYGGKALASGVFTKKALGSIFGGKAGGGIGALGKKAVPAKKKGIKLHKKKEAGIHHSLDKSYEGHKKGGLKLEKFGSGHKKLKENYGHAHLAGGKHPYIESSAKYDKFKKDHKDLVDTSSFEGGHVDEAKKGGKGKSDMSAGGKLIKDKAQKSYGFKNVYHKTEYGDHKSYKDDFEDVDYKKKHEEKKDYFDKHGGKVVKAVGAKKILDAKKHGDDFHKHGKAGFHGYKKEGHKKGNKHFHKGHAYKDDKGLNKKLSYGLGRKAHKKADVSIPISYHSHLHG